MLVLLVAALTGSQPVSAGSKALVPGTLTNVYLEEDVTSELGEYSGLLPGSGVSGGNIC